MHGDGVTLFREDGERFFSLDRGLCAEIARVHAEITGGNRDPAEELAKNEANRIEIAEVRREARQLWLATYERTKNYVDAYGAVELFIEAVSRIHAVKAGA